MRSMHVPQSGPQTRTTTARPQGLRPVPDAPENWAAAAVHDVLAALTRTVAGPGFAHPAALTQDAITDYALTLIRLRECACAASFERLTNACDAIAVTVSRLIEDRRCACLEEKCAALTRFVVHAQAMIPATANSMKPHFLSIPESPATPNGIQIGRRARVLR
jgi:hypothetical protein